MTNVEQAKQYVAKQKLLGIEKFVFSYKKQDDTVKISQNEEYSWTEQDKDLVIPPFVTEIARKGFDGNRFIESITFQNANKITKIHSYAFYSCKRLTDIDLPQNIETIYEGTFEFCTQLKRVSMGDKVKLIKSEAFYECLELSKIRLSNNLTELESAVFHSCEKLKNINIPNSLKLIHYRAFANCWDLEKINIDFKNSSLLQIHKYAFEGCQRLHNKRKLAEFYGDSQ